MIDARFIAELDRTDSHNGTLLMVYIYETGDRTDGYRFSAGVVTPDMAVPVDGGHALFATVDAAIIFAAGWFAIAPDMRAVVLCKSADARAREIYANN